MKEITRVLKNRIMMGAVVASAALVPIAGVTALASSPAGAAKPKGITCTGGKGPVNTTTFSATINFTGCTGNTGAKGTSTAAQGDPTQTINWGNGKATVLNSGMTTGTKCPAKNLLADEIIQDTVATDNTGSTVPGAAATGEFCVTSKGSKVTIALLKGTDFKIAK
jgi:hypothetical protein